MLLPYRIVESTGEHVEEVKQGDTVVPVFFANCGECRDCKSQKSNVCTKFVDKHYNTMPRDAVGRFKDMKGRPIHHFLFVSSFTEYTVVDVTHVVKIPPPMPIDKACLLSCGVSTGRSFVSNLKNIASVKALLLLLAYNNGWFNETGLGAVWKVAQVEEGSTVAVFGLGAVGLAVRLTAMFA